MPFTFRDLGTTAKVAYELVGKAVWDEFSGSEEGKTMYLDSIQDQGNFVSSGPTKSAPCSSDS